LTYIYIGNTISITDYIKVNIMATRGKTKKVCITIPIELDEEVRKTVSKGEISAFFTEAMEYYLAHRKQLIAIKAGFGAWKTEDHPDLLTPEDTTRFIRSLRDLDENRLAQIREEDANYPNK
jgi:hypothetical protein